MRTNKDGPDLVSEHSWDLDEKQAADLQKKLSKKIITQPQVGNVRKIAGVDAQYERKTDRIHCAVLIFSCPELTLMEARTSAMKAPYPYISGFFSFREGPAVMDCFKKIQNDPDLIFFDGNGVMHPRRFGLASHLGLLLDRPSIGVAKSWMLGKFSSPGKQKGDFSYMTHEGDVIGAAVRTRKKTKPVFVSIGHKASLDYSVNMTVSFSRYRIPEPIRRAHMYLARFSS